MLSRHVSICSSDGLSQNFLLLEPTSIALVVVLTLLSYARLKPFPAL